MVWSRPGEVITRDRAACIEQLCNAGDQFEQKAAELGNSAPRREDRGQDSAAWPASTRRSSRESASGPRGSRS